MARAARTNSFRSMSTEHADLWIDYNVSNSRVTQVIVVNDGPNKVFGSVVTAKGASFHQVFDIGTTTLPVPANSGATVGFDASDGNAPFLSGLQSIQFVEPAPGT